MANDTVAAIATPAGRGGIGIVRITGSGLEPMLGALVTGEVMPRRATRADFRDADDNVIDQGLVLYFPAPHSYTGEDIIELHAHGGPVVLQLLLKRCLELGARIAEPGEFTKRAFLNEKLDLAQAESVADLIDASTATAARCAVRSLQGEFSGQIEALVQALTELRMLVEATIDFPEDEVDSLERGNAKSRLQDLQRRLSQIMAVSRQGRLLREGIQVVLAGQPNVGKSSLLNSLAGTERAIVTEIPGTTRDTIRETIDLDGVPLHIIDTAGLREPRDAVEKIGIERTWEAVTQADLVLWVSDATRVETSVADAALAMRLPIGVPQLRVINKIDLVDAVPDERDALTTTEVTVSAKTGAGLEQLRSAMLNAVGWAGSGEGLFMARERHLHALQVAIQHLDNAAALTRELELFAEELKLAQNALASVTGEVTADDLLGQIFSRFCIGK